MEPKPLHDPARGTLRAVALMSGSGTNLRKILEHGEMLKAKEGFPVYQVAAIFSDSWDSKANEIGRDHDIPVLTHDLAGWLRMNGVEREDLEKRERFDVRNVEILKRFDADFAIYAGYMAIASKTLIDAFVGINVHPADLAVKDGYGRRRWRGAHAVRDAVAAGEKTVRASTHLVTCEVDAGPLLMRSPGLELQVPKNADLADPETLRRVADRNQERLKEAGDWVIFPRTIEAVARGWFQIDEEGRIYYRGEPSPDGILA